MFIFFDILIFNVYIFGLFNSQIYKIPICKFRDFYHEFVILFHSNIQNERNVGQQKYTTRFFVT